jgi:hypothetical protein
MPLLFLEIAVAFKFLIVLFGFASSAKTDEAHSKWQHFFCSGIYGCHKTQPFMLEK